MKRTLLLIPNLAAWFILLASALPTHAFVPQWETTGEMGTERKGCTATLLPDGRVLVAGGYNGVTPYIFYASAELYDPATGTWESTGSMTSNRGGHRATLLPDGKVLVAGGYNGTYLASAELFDPGANGGLGAWTPAGSMSEGRVWHTMTLLADGRVLVTGGENGSGYFSSATADLYDPATGTWSQTASMAQHRCVHTATLLPNGQVLVAGGLWKQGGLDFGHDSAELYDPAEGAWSSAGLMTVRRWWHTATLLPGGKVLVAGGQYGATLHRSAELYDPADNTWSGTGSMTTARTDYTATLLSNGYVMVAGGFSYGPPPSSAERFDPAANGGLGAWSTAGSMAENRFNHSAALLLNGRVLVLGGYSGSVPRSSAELYAPVSEGPFLGSKSPAIAKPGAVVTIRGYNFEATQGSSTVTFNGVDAGIAAGWSDGEITIKVPPGAGSGSVAVAVGGVTSNALFFQVIQGCDYDGDGLTDITVWRPGPGIWYNLRTSDGGYASQQWGQGALGDLPVPGDYDGDGKTDFAVWRKDSGTWYVLRSSTGGVTAQQWGLDSLSDVPVPGDYSGDGKTDIAVWRRDSGNWYVLRSAAGGVTAQQWGLGSLNDVPVPGDYDGDGKTDVAVWRQDSGVWYVLRSGDGGVTSQQWGLGSLNDVPVPGDYDGDGKTDIAVWRNDNGVWYVLRSSDGGMIFRQWGMSGDKSVNRPVHLWGSP